MKVPRVAGAVVVAAVLGLAGCGGGEAGTAAVPSPAAGAVPDTLAFSLPRVGGGTVEGADYAGRPVAFWFWAPG